MFFGSLLEQGFHKFTWTSEEIAEIKENVLDAETTPMAYEVKKTDINKKFEPSGKRWQSIFNLSKTPGQNIQKIILEKIKQQVDTECEVEVRHVALLGSEPMDQHEMETVGPQKLHIDGDDEKYPRYGFSILLSLEDENKPAFLRVVPGSHRMTTDKQRFDASNDRECHRLLRIEWNEGLLFYRLFQHGGWMYGYPHKRIHAYIDVWPKGRRRATRKINDESSVHWYKQTWKWCAAALREIRTI